MERLYTSNVSISTGNIKCQIGKSIFAVILPLKLSHATVTNTDLGSLRSLHTFLKNKTKQNKTKTKNKQTNKQTNKTRGNENKQWTHLGTLNHCVVSFLFSIKRLSSIYLCEWMWYKILNFNHFLWFQFKSFRCHGNTETYFFIILF